MHGFTTSSVKRLFDEDCALTTLPCELEPVLQPAAPTKFSS